MKDGTSTSKPNNLYILIFKVYIVLKELQALFQVIIRAKLVMPDLQRYPLNLWLKWLIIKYGWNCRKREFTMWNQHSWHYNVYCKPRKYRIFYVKSESFLHLHLKHCESDTPLYKSTVVRNYVLSLRKRHKKIKRKKINKYQTLYLIYYKIKNLFKKIKKIESKRN